MWRKFISSRRASAALVTGATLTAALVLFATLPTRAAGPGGAGGRPAENPHWNADRCTACHTEAASQRKTIPVADADRACLKCHDGTTATAEAHPIGRPVAKDRPVPAAWPLADGRLACLTCHYVKQACAPDAARDSASVNLLRPSPPLTSTGEKPANFCRNCHAPEEFPRLNPHAMLTPARDVVADRCLTCHTQVQDRAAKERTGQPLLRGSQSQLCLACHSKHKDQFSPGHLGAKVKPEMLAFMRAREALGPSTPLTGDMLKQLTDAGAKPTMMHLTADGGIACTTCHNPHQAGVFAPGTSLAYRPMRIVGGRTLSPVRGNQWCNHCHDL